jgi:LysM repeat protein
MPGPSDNPLRPLAPLALVLFAIALVAVVLGSDSGGDQQERRAAEQTTTAPRQRSEPSGPARSTYTVKSGDTLAAISRETGVSVETLQELNPQLDPQALVSGQKIKLRE